MSTGPTLDDDLYSFATGRMESRAIEKIRDAVDTHGLAHWFSSALSEAYSTGLRDGYVQGRHDRHNESNGVEPALHGENGPDSRDAS